MTKPIQILRTSTDGTEPDINKYEPGQPYINFANRQFGVIGEDKIPVNLLAIRKYTSTSSYAEGEIAYRGDVKKLYKCRTAGGIPPHPFVGGEWSQVDLIFVSHLAALFKDKDVVTDSSSAVPGIWAVKADIQGYPSAWPTPTDVHRLTLPEGTVDGQTLRWSAANHIWEVTGP